MSYSTPLSVDRATHDAPVRVGRYSTTYSIALSVCKLNDVGITNSRLVSPYSRDATRILTSGINVVLTVFAATIGAVVGGATNGCPSNESQCRSIRRRMRFL